MLIAAGVCLRPHSAAAQSPQILAPEGYIDLAGLWDPAARILVCWEPGADTYALEKSWVRHAVKTLIEDASSVRFHSWDECTTGDMGIRITIADERPNSEVGRQWARDPNDGNVMRQDVWGQWIQLPTRMVLNFVFNFDPNYKTGCQPDREHCIRAIAVHEFLHAIGFLHEQLHPDASADCKLRHAHDSDFRGFRPTLAALPYDADSLMNYCANLYRKPIQLSQGDLAVLRKFYTTQ